MEYNSKIIVIPDIHGRSFWKGAVRGHEADRIVFLGDYVDPYTNEGLDQGEGIKALESVIGFKKKHPENVTLLLGNHDLGYIDTGICSCRRDKMNEADIRKLLMQNLDLFDIVHECENNGYRYIFSHAGITVGWVEQQGERLSGVRENPEILNEMFHDNSTRPTLLKMLSDVSYIRGGEMDWGSPVWAHSDELISGNNNIPGFVQLFGHTQRNRPASMVRGMAFCLDCRRAFVLDTFTARIDVEKDWMPSVPWMKEKLAKHYDEILDGITIDAGMAQVPFFDGKMCYADNQLLDSVLGTVWGYILIDCQSVVKETKNLSMELMAKALDKGKISCESIGEQMIIHMDNHDYSFWPKDGTDAYGGPHDVGSFNSGGMTVNLPPDVFVIFLKSFDSMVPEIITFIKHQLQMDLYLPHY